MLHHITRATRHLIFWSLIGFAIALTILRLMLGSIEIYKGDLEAKLSAELAAPVKIQRVGAGMQAFRPALVLKNLQVFNPQQPKSPVVEIKDVRVSVDLLHFIRQQPLISSAYISLIGAKLAAKRDRQGHISIIGLPPSTSPPPLWLLESERIEIFQGQLHWQDEQLPQLQRKTGAPKNAKPGQLFSDVNILLKNIGDQQHVINLSLKLPAHQGESLQLAMQLRGNYLAENGVNGLLYVKGKRLALATLAKEILPPDIKLQKGAADLQLWSYWQNSKATVLNGSVQLHGLNLQQANHPDLNFKNIAWQFNAAQQTKQWHVKADKLAVQGDALLWQDAKFSLDLQLEPSLNITKAILQLPHTDVQALQHVSHFWSSGNTQPVMQGQLQRVYAMIEPAQQHFMLQADLENFSSSATAAYPGINNLNARINGNHHHGTIDLSLKNSSLELPDVFAKPLTVSSANTRLTWEHSDQGWTLSTPKLSLAVPENMQMLSRLQLAIAKDTYALDIDFQGEFAGKTDVKTFFKFLPSKIMGDETNQWLARSFTQGRAKPVGVLLKGNLADFPFKQQQGVFEFILGLEDVTLAYDLEWGALEHMDAELVFHQNGMFMQAEAAVQQAKLEQFNINIPSFDTSNYVDISGKAHGKFADLFGYLQRSPIKAPINDLLDVLSVKGDADLDLHVQVPLVDQLALTINGKVASKQANLEVLALDLPITAVNGVLNFDDHGITDGEFQGHTLGAQLNGKLNNSPEKMLVTLDGHTSITALQQHFKVPHWNFADGDSDYQVQVNIPYAKAQPANVQLHSSLAGVSLKLPDILGKPASERRALDMNIQLGEQTLLPITLNYADRLSANFKFDSKHQHIEHAQVAIGNNGSMLPKLPPPNHLSINLAQVSSSDWLALVAADDSNNSKPLFEHIQFQGQHLLWQEQDLGRINLSMQPKKEGWQISIDSALLKGQIFKPTSNTLQDKPIYLDLDEVNLSALMPTSKKAVATKIKPAATPGRIPLFELSSKQLLWRNVDLGALTLSTRRTNNGIDFPQVSLKNAKGILTMDGSWLIANSQPSMRINGELNSQAFGKYLAKLDLTHDLRLTQALIKFNLSWPGGPQDFALGQLGGNLDVLLTNGRILSIEPGFGRILGFLAMEQWGRRLRLDFSDLFLEGLMFNSIRGHFELQQGNATTEQLLIDAIPAEIIIKGTTHLGEQTLNHHMTVLPKSSAAVPIAGTIVDKMLTFAAKTVTGDEQEGFLLGTEFNIRGNWQNPEVKQLHENDGLLQKFWYGIGEFPWLP